MRLARLLSFAALAGALAGAGCSPEGVGGPSSYDLSLAVTPSPATVAVGQQLELHPVVTDQVSGQTVINAPASISFNIVSDNPDVADVGAAFNADGTVTWFVIGNGAGTATLTATMENDNASPSGTLSAQIPVTVVEE